MGRKIGKLLKVDACTSSTIKGWYAHICIQIDLGKPVKRSITIVHHKQQLLYNGEKILCKSYGFLGHTTQNCVKKGTTQTSALESLISPIEIEADDQDE